MSNQNFITSHRYRVRRMKENLHKWPDKVSLLDREAFVEFYLLEDIIRLYEYRIAQEKKAQYNSPQGEKIRQRNIERFTAIKKVFDTATDICEGQLRAGNYTLVWSSINERALMRAAGNPKNLSVMSTLAVKLLKDLYGETIEVVDIGNQMDEDIEDLDAHDANVRSVQGLPSRDEIDAMISEVERVISGNPNTNDKPNQKPNLV